MRRLFNTVNDRRFIVALALLFVFSFVCMYSAFKTRENPNSEEAVFINAMELFEEDKRKEALAKIERIQELEPTNSKLDASGLYNTAGMLELRARETQLMAMRELYMEALSMHDDEDTRKNLEIVTYLLIQELKKQGRDIGPEGFGPSGNEDGF